LESVGPVGGHIPHVLIHLAAAVLIKHGEEGTAEEVLLAQTEDELV
jgi:hypothetical protein